MIYVGISLAVACFASYLGSMRWLKINHERLRTDKNARLKILLISDFHCTSEKRTNSRLWEKIHSLEFDMVALTGDLLQRRLLELEPLKSHLQRLVARAPVYFVDGNHEKFIYRELFAELEKIGVTVLDNRRISANINGCEINIIGTADFYRLKRDGFSGLDELFRGSGGDKFTLVLSHQPQIIDRVKNYAPDLLLCGHTHGGQVRFPLLPALFAPGQGLFPAYDHGWYRVGTTDFFISKGIGATYFNVRFFNRPEVAVIEVSSNK